MNLIYAHSGLDDYRPFAKLFDSFRPDSYKDTVFQKDDVLLFEGGTDIYSKLYGEDPGPYNQKPNQSRDMRECNLFKAAVNSGIPMIGICRGAQLITALTGGKLIQHMEGHHGNPYLMFTGILKSKVIKGICSHHQSCIPTADAKILAMSIPDNVPEIFWYPKIKALCIQGHPAWDGAKEFTDTCVSLVKSYILGGK